MNKFEQIPSGNNNIEKTINAKSNAVFNAISDEGGQYKINAPRVNSKLLKTVREIMEKHNLEDSPERQEEISQKVLKNALERIAQDLGGNLRMEKDLEDKYIDILFNEGRKQKVINYGEIIEIIDNIDEKKILDNTKRADLMDRLVKEML